VLDQLFSADNFRLIYDLENRKGLDVTSQFFPSLGRHTIAIRQKAKEIKDLHKAKGGMLSDVFDAKKSELRSALKRMKADKSEAIDNELETISGNVTKSSFKLILSQKVGPKGKPVFCTNDSPEAFFVVKQLQRNINRIYKVKPGNRHDIACQLRDTLGSGFPFEVVRTDVSRFYENIDRKKLLNKLESDQLLSTSSLKFIKQILDSYGSIANSIKGIPRGVGISAYLAELFLRPIDRKIKSIPGLVLYCRYVDDIVAVFARPPAGKPLGSYKDEILQNLQSDGLSSNISKTKELKFESAVLDSFDYLGYCFTIESKTLKISPSNTKLKKT
jgi:hypothetical protein